MTDHQDHRDEATGAEEPAAGDRGGLDRRSAMKVALGGAVAAAAWSAPRIEGLSLAPDYAAAASCTGGTAGEITKNSNNCGYYGDTECFGNNCCGSWGFSANIASKFTLNGNISGDVSGDNGNVQMTINGIDPPWQRCTVNVGGTCNNASFRGGGTYTFNNNGTQNSFIDCQGGGSFLSADTDAQIRVNVTCVCL